MKKVIAWIAVLVMLFSLCACGAKADAEPTKDNGAAAGKTPTATKDGLDLGEALGFVSDDDPVEIYMPIMDFADAGAETYIADLQAENPDKEYRYYDENYYIEIVTEGERKEMLEELKDAKKFFADAFEDEYEGLIIGAELNAGMNKLTLQLNRSVYEATPLSGLVILFGGGMYVQYVQAFAQVPMEEREARLVCIDENGEIILDSAEMDSSTEETTADGQ